MNQQIEIERKQNITITMPQTCHFCGEEITKYGKESRSLAFHSLDRDHDNWVPENKVPAHYGCHIGFHNHSKKGNQHSEETKKKISNARTVEERSESAKKMWKTRQEKYGPSGMKDPESFIRALSERIKGHKNSEETRRKISNARPIETWSEAAKKGWRIRREKYGPSGRKR